MATRYVEFVNDPADVERSRNMTPAEREELIRRVADAIATACEVPEMPVIIYRDGRRAKLVHGRSRAGSAASSPIAPTTN